MSLKKLYHILFSGKSLKINKISDDKSHHLFYGASNGTRDEHDGVNMYTELVLMCLHETEIILSIEKLG